jgi:hypothetical protein
MDNRRNAVDGHCRHLQRVPLDVLITWDGFVQRIESWIWTKEDIAKDHTDWTKEIWHQTVAIVEAVMEMVEHEA